VVGEKPIAQLKRMRQSLKRLAHHKLVPVRSRRRSPLVWFGLPGILGAQSVCQ
jgi:hypothetical protein